MKVICSPRQSGKTTEIIRLCNQLNKEHGMNDTIIVVTDFQRARAVAAQAEEMGYKGMPFPCIMEEIFRNPHTFYKYVLIDDMDRVMQKMLGQWQLVGYSITDESLK